MNKIVDSLTLRDFSVSWKQFSLMVLIAYLFAVCVRLIWVYQFADFDQYYWNGVLMINTNDGYQFAEGARDLIAGFHQENDLSTGWHYLSKLTVALNTVWPGSFESLILYMPTIFGSLLVIPVLLLGRMLGMEGAGFVGALLAGIAWSYYNRTMTGYYDTDLLIVVLPALMVVFYIAAFHQKRYWLLPWGPIFAIMAMTWHSGGLHLSNAIFYFSIGYILLFERRDKFNYKILIVFMIALISLPIWTKIMSIFLLSGVFFYFRDRLKDEVVYALFGFVIILFVVFDGHGWISTLLGNSYLFRPAVADDLNLSLQYFGVINTVREAGQIPFETFANRISGHPIVLYVSVFGYLLLIIRRPIMLLTLPMVGLGFFAVQGGLRFTVFAVPWMAFGLGYLIFVIGGFLSLWPRVVFIALAAAGALYPNIVHIQSYKVPTVFDKQEVEVLDKLKNIAQREDYVDTWWDYGYPVRYYSDVKTLVDGGAHHGAQNMPVSFALSYPNIVAAANMARLNVEFQEIDFKQPCGFPIECMLKHYNEPDPSRFIQAIGHSDFPLPEKTRDVYFYLPFRMMEIFPTVKLFSNLDLVSGKQNPRPLFYQSTNFQDDGNMIRLGAGIDVIKEGGKIKIGGKEYPLKQFIVTGTDSSGKVFKNVQEVHPQSPITVIFMQSYNVFLVLDDSMLNSLYIRLFVLEDYPQELFEPVILNPYAKVFKLKI